MGNKKVDVEIRNTVYITLENKIKQKVNQWKDDPTKYDFEDFMYWLTMLTEETGEVAKAILTEPLDSIEDELYDVAIIAVFWLNIIEHLRKRYNFERI